MLRVSPDFKFLNNGNAGWHEFFGNQALAEARKSFHSGVVFAAVSGAACVTSKNILVRAAAIGFGVGSFLVAAKQTTDGVKLKRTATKLRAATSQRPEPILPKPPAIAVATKVKP